MESNRSSSEIYHTVSLRDDLPKIPKYYKEESLKDLSPNDFWMKKLDPLYAHQDPSSLNTNRKYEIQYGRINGPCKFIKFSTGKIIF
jgi:hypothetical protein